MANSSAVQREAGAMESWRRFDDTTRGIVLRAQQTAVEYGLPSFGRECILLGLLMDEACAAFSLLSGAGADVLWLEDFTRTHLTVQGVSAFPRQGEPILAEDGKLALSATLRYALARGSQTIRSHHLLRSLIEDDDTWTSQAVRNAGARISHLLELVDGAEDEPSAPGEPSGQEATSAPRVVHDCGACGSPLLAVYGSAEAIDATLVCDACGKTTHLRIS